MAYAASTRALPENGWIWTQTSPSLRQAFFSLLASSLAVVVDSHKNVLLPASSKDLYHWHIRGLKTYPVSVDTDKSLQEQENPSSEAKLPPTILRQAIAVVALAGIFVSTYLLLYKMGVLGGLSCQIGSCEKVNTSRWATFLSIPVAGWGVGYYCLLFLLSLASTEKPLAGAGFTGTLLVCVTATGTIFSAWLTYLELFVIHAICQWCVISAILATTAFALAVKARNQRL